MVCSKCGKKVKDDVKFCPFCGTKLGGGDADQSDWDLDSTVECGDPLAAGNQKSKKNRPGLVVGVLVSVLILAVVIISAVRLLNGGAEDNDGFLADTGDTGAVSTDGVVESDSAEESDDEDTVAAETQTVYLVASITEDGETVIEYTYDSESRTLVGVCDGALKQIIIYNEYGQISTNYGSFYEASEVDSDVVETDYVCTSWWEYEYDAEGNCTASISYYADEEEIYSVRAQYTTGGMTWSLPDAPSVRQSFDADGNQLSEVRYDSDGEIYDSYEFEYTYDSEGNLVTGVMYDSDGEVSGSYEDTYDSEGNLLTQVRYDSDEEIFLTYEYTYDADGNVLTMTVDFYINGQVYFSQEYTYDADGNILTYSTGESEAEYEYQTVEFKAY